MKLAVILPAAGASRRFGGTPGASKVEALIAGRPVFLHALEPFLAHRHVEQVLLAVAPDALDAFQFRYGDRLRLQGIELVAGGRAERWETVLKALERVDESCSHVAVHDAARPLLSAALLERVLEAAMDLPAVVPALPVTDTLKRVGTPATPADPANAAPGEGAAADIVDAILGPNVGQPADPDLQRVVETIDRDALVAVQTPQVFDRALLVRAYARLTQGEAAPTRMTDDASLVEALGEAVHVIPGEPLNLKITTQQDLELAASLLEHRQRERAAADEERKRLFGDDGNDE
ncbi:MAG: 2-C-methyl-D-erythritol 4-phosphate cytidylyltransferase [Phycisphaeraceae bacterium]